MKKQTAVEWLNDELSKIFYLESDLGSEFESSQVNLWMIKIIIEAKAMEKKQIIDAVKYGHSDWGSAKNSEQYYNETYGGDK